MEPTPGTQPATPLVPLGIQRPLRIRHVDIEAPWRWLEAGWRDLSAAPSISLGVGVVVALATALLTAGLLWTGWLSLILPLGLGFLLIGPLVAASLYDVSRRLERREQPTLGGALRAGLDARGQLGFFGFMLSLFFFAWMNFALLLFMLFYGDRPPPPLELFTHDLLFTWKGLGLLVVGTAIGALLASIAFTVSAVAVPLLMVEDIDAVSAGLASIQAVRSNWQAMAMWAVLVAALMALGVATLGVGLVVAFPLVGHATWHAFRDTIRID